MDKSKKKGEELGGEIAVEAPVSPPEGYERSVRGAGFVGFFRANEGDVLSGILRGPAPEAVQERSLSKYGVGLVELLHACVVSASASQLEGRDMSRWRKGPKNRNGQDTYLTRAEPGEIVAVSIREAIKEEMALPEGTGIWLRVGAPRQIPGTTNTMYDYEKYIKRVRGVLPPQSSPPHEIPF